MAIETQLSPERIAEAKKAGLWGEKTLLDYFESAVRSMPDKVALTAYYTSQKRTVTFSYRQLDRLSLRVALGLNALGVRAGDVVSMILPNWAEFPIVHLACLRIGAITNPLMPILRQRELSFMLNLAESKVLIIPKTFRNCDYPQMIADIRGDLPDLKHVITIGGNDPDSFEALFLNTDLQAPQDNNFFSYARPKADTPIEILYTSGTTGEPKGVVHSSNTLLSSLPFLQQRLRLTADDVVLMASPLAHQTGFVYGMMLSIVLGAKCVLLDVWDAEEAIRLIEEEGVTFTMASTPFLSDTTRAAATSSRDLRHFRYFLAAGAPIPSVLVQHAMDVIGVCVLSGWGMTENGLVTVTRPDDPKEKPSQTDGVALEHMRVRIVDERNVPVPPGIEGRLQAQGANNFIGYLKRPQFYDMSADGWFETGDNARMDQDGYIRICSRSKDIIIRGGENIPVFEVEQILYRHPAIRDVAIVAMPDARLGEKACAFVTLKPGATFSFYDMTSYMKQEKITPQYIPERLEIVDDLPRTASGKIQKFALRQTAKNFSA